MNAALRPSTPESETLKDIEVLHAVRSARLQFNLKLIEASADKSESVAVIMRSDAAYQLAEFYFLLEAFGIRSTQDFDGLIERHNAYISSLLRDDQKMSRLGLGKDRLLASIFDGETKPRVLRLWADNPGTIDQSSLGRLLVSVMSDETTRKVLVAFGKAGLLKREPSPFRMVLVRSTGLLERIYGECLRDIRVSIMGGNQEKLDHMRSEGRSPENQFSTARREPVDQDQHGASFTQAS